MNEISTSSIVAYVISGLVIIYLLYNFLRAKKRMNRPASENVKILDDGNFEHTISKGVSLVDFWAAWCGPCKVQGPIVDEVADELNKTANICKLDIDKNQRIAKKFGIKNIPTMMVFKDGLPVEKMVGVKPKGVILKTLKPYLS